ncbi:MAG: hypothetical protein Q9181_001652 [Wetmoreana brouardii]
MPKQKQKQSLRAQKKVAKRKDTVRMPFQRTWCDSNLTDCLARLKAPETENEYLAVGVDFEEAGEKWRAGDAEKSARFFHRALYNYAAGLNRFPQSLDLAYNRYALRISRDNADLLFNTGQVLSSLAELISEPRDRSDDTGAADPLYLLQEALECFQRCASLQEHQVMQQEKDVNQSAQEAMELDEQAAATITSGAVFAPRPTDAEPSDGGTWVSIKEPVTPNSLLDTLLAQIEALTSVCGILSSEGVGDLDWIEQYHDDLLSSNVLHSGVLTHRHLEFVLSRARLKCALADARFSIAKLNIDRYEQELAEALEPLKLVPNEPQALCDMADAEIVFNASIERFADRILRNASDVNIIRWKHLTKAVDHLTAASKLWTAKNLPRIHLRRGDCEMLRRRLGAAPWNYDLASKSAPTLLKNAEIYYRGAGKLAKGEDAADEEEEALTKGAVAAALAGDPSRFREKVGSDMQKVQDILKDAVEEGVILSDDIQMLGV